MHGKRTLTLQSSVVAALAMHRDQPSAVAATTNGLCTWVTITKVSLANDAI